MTYQMNGNAMGQLLNAESMASSAASAVWMLKEQLANSPNQIPNLEFQLGVLAMLGMIEGQLTELVTQIDQIDVTATHQGTPQCKVAVEGLVQ